MKTYDLTPILENIRKTVEAHKLAPGSYARWPRQDASGSRETGENPYGCADAANILYSIGEFPRGEQERQASVSVLQAMQGEGGLFTERTHHPIHTTAHCTAALELFDAAPLRPCTALFPYLKEERLYALLEGLDWDGNPWRDSHRGAGVYTVLRLTEAADAAWSASYFSWLWENTDPYTGFWSGKAGSREGHAPGYFYMAAAFHYLFNLESAHMPLRYPEKIIDSCIAMYDDPKGLPRSFGTQADFLEIDWIFCLTRASRQTPHRFREVQELLGRFADRYLDYWLHADFAHDESLQDLHRLFGGVCALCELQQTLRGHLLSEKPLRLVLDRRPFI